jgi:hypothetical protein
MQISASNLIIAAQQARSPAAAPAPRRAEPARGADAAAPAGEAPQFEAIAFKTAPPANATPIAKPVVPFAPAKRMGSQLDIKV